MSDFLPIDNFLDGYEIRLYRGYKKTLGDKAKDKKIVTDTLRDALETTISVQVAGGTVEDVPIIAYLIGAKLKYLAENPSKIDLKELATVLGETKQEVKIQTETASDVFAGVAVVDDEDDSNT